MSGTACPAPSGLSLPTSLEAHAANFGAKFDDGLVAATGTPMET